MSSTPRQDESLNNCQRWAKPRDMTWLSLPESWWGQGNLLHTYGKAYKLNVFWQQPPESRVSILSRGSALAQCQRLQRAAQGQGHKEPGYAWIHPCILLVMSTLWYGKEWERKKPSVLSPGFYFANYWHLTMEENTAAFFTCFVSSAIFFCSFQCNGEFVRTRKMRYQHWPLWKSSHQQHCLAFHITNLFESDASLNPVEQEAWSSWD